MPVKNAQRRATAAFKTVLRFMGDIMSRFKNSANSHQTLALSVLWLDMAVAFALKVEIPDEDEWNTSSIAIFVAVINVFVLLMEPGFMLYDKISEWLQKQAASAAGESKVRAYLPRCMLPLFDWFCALLKKQAGSATEVPEVANTAGDDQDVAIEVDNTPGPRPIAQH